MRLDIYLVEKKLCKSRTSAQELIKSGGVSLDGKPCTKPSAETDDSRRVEITGERLRYVGRGGLKLEAALERFGIDLSGKECIDIGASTGGFTDCMLQHGAAKVYAVDVGTNQLADSLRSDPRVISMERTDIRNAELSQADFIGTDVSFISLKLIIPHIFRLLKSGGSAAVLIKPQFEAGRAALSKNGIVRDERIRLKVRDETAEFAAGCGFEVIGTEQSPITGGDGNVEYLMCLKKG